METDLRTAAALVVLPTPRGSATGAGAPGGPLLGRAVMPFYWHAQICPEKTGKQSQMC